MSYSQAWLDSQDAIRGILVEVNVSISGAADTTIYLSNIGFMTTDALISFNPIISNSVTVNDNMSLDGQVSMSFGDIELFNPTGDLDIWFDSTYVWVNKSIKVYVGDPSWAVASLAALHDANTATSKFKKVFDGLVEDVGSRTRNTVNIKVRDKLQRLNTPITETELGPTGVWGGTGTGGLSGLEAQSTQHSIIPLVFGEVFNIEPLLEDPATITYRINQGTTEKIIEIRDNGVPIYTEDNSGITRDSSPVLVKDLTVSRITLQHPLAGTITMSLQGVKKSRNLTTGAASATYVNNIANIIALIATEYGNTAQSQNYAAGDLDLPNLAAFQTANPQPVGVAIFDKANTLQVCQDLAASIGAQVHMSSEGKLGLVRLGVYTTIGVTHTDPGGTTTTITDNDIIERSLEISQRSVVRAATILNYCKNWTTQEDLLTLIPTDHKKLFKEESFAPETAPDSTVAANYKISLKPDPVDTLLVSQTDAAAEALRRNNYFKVPRTIYKFTGTSKLLSLTLGQQVTLVHNRFNLYNGGSGRVGQVISLNSDWAKSTVEVEVII